LFDSEAGLNSYGVKSTDKSHHVAIVPLAVDLDSFYREIDIKVIRDKYKLPLNVPIIVYTARFEPHKNHILALEVADRLNEYGLPAHMVFIGSHGSLRQQIEFEVSLRNNVTILSGVKSIIEVLRASDLFFFPSINEGFGVVAIEACAAGLPVIATNLPSIKEAIPPQLHELMFEADDVEEAIKSLTSLIEDDTLRKKAGTLCKDWSRVFSVQHSADSLVNVYRTIMTGR